MTEIIFISILANSKFEVHVLIQHFSICNDFIELFFW